MKITKVLKKQGKTNNNRPTTRDQQTGAETKNNKKSKKFGRRPRFWGATTTNDRYVSLIWYTEGRTSYITNRKA